MTDEDLEFKRLALDMTDEPEAIPGLRALIGLLPKTGIWMIIGAPKAGKTMLLTALTIALDHQALYRDEFAPPFEENIAEKMFYLAARKQVPAIICVTAARDSRNWRFVESTQHYRPMRLYMRSDVAIQIHEGQWNVIKCRAAPLNRSAPIDLPPFSGRIDFRSIPPTLAMAYELVCLRSSRRPCVTDRITWAEERAQNHKPL